MAQVDRSKRKLRSGPGAKPDTVEEISIPIEIKKPLDQSMELDFAAAWKTRLQSAIAKAGSNPRRISLAAGLNATTVRSMLVTGRSPTIETILPIAQVLEISLDWLFLGRGSDLSKGGTEDVKDRDDSVQVVPVISWQSVPAFAAHQRVDAIREERAEMIYPADGRFRLDFHGSAMTGVIEDGDIIDCSLAMHPDPEDVVIAWLSLQKRCVAARILPSEYGMDGKVARAHLHFSNEKWPALPFDSNQGDKVLAVVFDVIRPLRRDVRRRA